MKEWKNESVRRQGRKDRRKPVTVRNESASG